MVVAKVSFPLSFYENIIFLNVLDFVKKCLNFSDMHEAIKESFNYLKEMDLLVEEFYEGMYFIYSFS